MTTAPAAATGLAYWQGANLTFWIITALVVASAGFAAFSRSIVRAAFSLFFTLCGMAGYYVLLGSDFVAVTQVIIYVGGILVLLMFGILLTNRSTAPVEGPFSKKQLVALLTGTLLFLFVLLRIIFSGEWHVLANLAEPVSNLRPIGRLLLTDYVLALEISGMTLLLCLVGAAYLVRRKER